MRVVIQRVSRASVTVEGKITGKIDRGILALIGINSGDNDEVIRFVVNKLINLRIFEDENEKMNLSTKDIGGGLLLVPNFTIYADAGHGRRPSFAGGARSDEAEGIFERMVQIARESYENVQTGIFKADMKVELLNDGPVTIILERECE